MLVKRPLLALSALALVALACGCNVDLPRISLGTAEAGPTQTEHIQIPVPDADPAALKLEFGAGELFLAPGAADALVEGTATYNVEKLKPVITQSASGATLSTGKLGLNDIPFTPFDLGAKAQNTWDLKLGSQPFDLTISAGAYHAEMDLGGLSIKALTVEDGASDVQIDFSEPNQVAMSRLSYTTGASSVSLSTLANARFDTLVFDGGAGSYSLDFTGQLQSDADVTIKAGLGQVTLVIPGTVPVIFDISGGVTNIDMQGSFQGGGRQFNQSGSGPSLTIHVDMGAGNLVVRNP